MTVGREGELAREKRAVRELIRGLRDAMPESERLRRGAQAVDRMLGLPEIGAAQVLMAFSSFGSEVHTGRLLEVLHEKRTRLALPKVVDGVLVALAYEPGDDVAPSSFGAMEPVAWNPVDPSSIDVVITPGVAFDRLGHRIGYGGGYFDRFFQETAPGAFRAGLAFAMQLRDEALPVSVGDLRIDALVTEREVARWSGAEHRGMVM